MGLAFSLTQYRARSFPKKVRFQIDNPEKPTTKHLNSNIELKNGEGPGKRSGVCKAQDHFKVALVPFFQRQRRDSFQPLATPKVSEIVETLMAISPFH